MNGPHTNLALVFDFDDTLVPDSTSRLLEENGVDPETFWSTEFRSLVEDGYDPTLAYLQLVLDRIGEDNPLGCLSRDDLRSFGASLNDSLYPGVLEFFKNIREIVDDYRDVDVDFYIVSGGLADVIRGTDVFDYMTAVYGCEVAERDGVIRKIRRAVSFTEKTRYLFEINKGIEPRRSRRNPYLVNEDLAPEHRRIPFDNFIYVGDGLTDIPCFSLVEKSGGKAFGIFEPGEEESAKKAVMKLLGPRRVSSLHAPDFRPDRELGSLLRAVVRTRCAEAVTDQQQALQ